MPAHIRLAVPTDASLLPRIERSAAQAFRSIEGLGWLADAATLTVDRHRQLISLSTCWVTEGPAKIDVTYDDTHITPVDVIHQAHPAELRQRAF